MPGQPRTAQHTLSSSPVPGTRGQLGLLPGGGGDRGGCGARPGSQCWAHSGPSPMLALVLPRLGLAALPWPGAQSGPQAGLGGQKCRQGWGMGEGTAWDLPRSWWSPPGPETGQGRGETHPDLCWAESEAAPSLLPPLPTLPTLPRGLRGLCLPVSGDRRASCPARSIHRSLRPALTVPHCHLPPLPRAHSSAQDGSHSAGDQADSDPGPQTAWRGGWWGNPVASVSHCLPWPQACPSTRSARSPAWGSTGQGLRRAGTWPAPA